MNSSQTGGRSFEIWEVFGASADDLWLLVHSELDPDDWETFRAAVVRVVGGQARVERLLDTWAMAMWRSAAGAVFVGDMSGRVHIRRGDNWSVTQLGAPSASDIWGLDDNEVYCSAGKGRFFRLIEGRWSLFNRGLVSSAGAAGANETQDLYAIGGTGANDLYVLGDSRVYHCNGTNWDEVDVPTDSVLTKVLALSKHEVYFSGKHGSFFCLRDGVWEDLSVNDREIHLRGIAAFQGEIYVGSHVEQLFVRRGNRLVAATSDIGASLRVIGDRLVAFGNNKLQILAGGRWTEAIFDFSTLVSFGP